MIRSALLMAAVLLTCGFALVAFPTNTTGYLAAAIDKHQLIENAKSPKIVFVGGSNAAFGVESEEISNRYNRDVVNMGLHGGLGLRYMLREAQPFIHRGDVFVVSPEYPHFHDLLDGDEDLLDLLAVYPHALASFSSFGQYAMLAKSFSAHLRQRLRLYLYMSKNKQAELNGPVYFRKAFNRFGDVESQVGRKGSDFTKQDLMGDTARSSFHDSAIRELNAFHRLAAARGARSILVLPHIPEAHYERQKSGIDYVYEQLRRKSEMPVIGDPHSMLLPVTDFFDTPYHLNEQGRRLRTNLLISVLDSVVPRSSPHTPPPAAPPARP